MTLNWVIAHNILLIWNPDLMNFITDKRRRKQVRLYYKTRGIVEHDRELNHNQDSKKHRYDHTSNESSNNPTTICASESCCV